ncbi:MAG TPA: carboxylating nicotinate-nucleotide diphosphorylase [Syntrophorhabdaceae bacterium]|nr:carboxylating nicotinate-nucleotide diphosphorylase [Syntrophorhabdaceae bacterium]
MKDFLQEDMGVEDVTTNAVVPQNHRSRAKIIAKADGVLAGQDYAALVFRELDENIDYRALKKDGERISRGDTAALIEGKTRAILTGERVALNILQRLSGIATVTARFVHAVQGTDAKILDTRKTAPGLRYLEKYAVRMGGGFNHRIDLTEMALIKENHISAASSIKEAVKKVKAYAAVPVEVEVRNMDELREAIEEPVDRIMLDNWDLEATRQAVALVGRKVPLEASGNMTLERVAEVARTGVDFISVGALTHSFNALDLSLLYEASAS